MKRNSFVVISLIFLSMSCQSVPDRYFSDFPRGSDIVLEKPESKIDVDLIKAFELRKSTQEFSEKEVSIKELSTILWAANGINRKDGKRTAPALFGMEVIRIYVFSNSGIYLYDATQNTLLSRSSKDARKDVGSKRGGAGGTETASLVLLLTGDPSMIPDFMSKDMRLNAAYASAGTIGQNVYLIANALGLKTRLVGALTVEGIRGCLKLSEDETPLYIMPLGYGK
jgi:nitroreductase